MFDNNNKVVVTIKIIIIIILFVISLMNGEMSTIDSVLRTLVASM